MNILVIGSGAREHAIIAALKRSPQEPNIYCISQALNPAIKAYTKDYLIEDLNDNRAIVSAALAWRIDITIIGPEAPLANGLADALWQESIAVIGPKKSLAKIETSKYYARNLMRNFEIPGLPEYRYFENMNGIEKFLHKLGEGNYVIKADGLMGGKGVKVAGDHLHSIAEALNHCEELFKTQSALVIEEKLEGQEFSLMCFCDGQRAIPMPVVQDHKRAFEGDKGPNTGGMGSYSDVNHRLPFLSKEHVEQAIKINQSVFRALMIQEKQAYIGILYGGFMLTTKGVYVIEYNARFGDPEALNILTLLNSDFLEICQSLVAGNLSEISIEFAEMASVCKYAVPDGYPDTPVKDKPIDISAVSNKDNLYLAAVDERDGQLIATGSRTAAYVGLSHSLSEAEHIAEKEISSVKGSVFHRKDIGTESLITQKVEMMRSLKK